MAAIAVYHPVFGGGGGEAVCMNVLEALQTDHDVTLYTLSTMDIEDANAYFDTAVSPDLAVRTGGVGGAALSRSYRHDAVGMGRLHAGLFMRAIQPHLARHDLVVSTFGECRADPPVVQYVHYPMFNRRAIPPEIEDRRPLRRAYDAVCDVVSGYRRHSVEGTVLANSAWTADLTERVHDVPVERLYPPVNTAGFEPRPWTERTDGFVAVGRLAPSKRIETLIEIVERLQARGHDLPLRIVGPTSDDAYGAKIRRRVADNDRITLEGRVSRERLLEFLCTYKYGIHGMQNEHFGIVVAEFVAGGAIPFVHDSGGQREIVGDEPRLRYRSVEDAVSNVERVLTDADEQSRLRASLPDVEERFGAERFRGEMRRVVAQALDGGA